MVLMHVSSIPDDQMMYKILRRVCRWYTMSWDYESRWSLAPLLSRATDISTKIPQLLLLPYSGELISWSEQVQASPHSSSVPWLCCCS